MSGAGSTLPSLQGHEGLTTVGCGLSIVSTVIGGGMVGLPYAILLLGLVLGFSLLAFSAITVHYSSYLYFAIREQVPGNFSSLYEMAYALQGRKSIFIIASVNIVISAGLMLIYFIVYGTTAATLMGSIFSPDDPTKYIYG